MKIKTDKDLKSKMQKLRKITYKWDKLKTMKPLDTNYPKASHEAPKPMAIQNSHAPS